MPTRPPHARTRALRALPLAALALAAACGRGKPDASSSAKSGGEEMDRVVCVSKQINEFIYAIGAEGHLIGRDLTSVYPAQIARVPSVGYHRALSAEGIISLRPSALLTDGNVGPDAVLGQVRKVGIPVVTMNPGSTPDSAQALMLKLGDAFGRRAAADGVVSTWRQGMRQAAADSLRWAGKPKPRVLLVHFGQLINNYLAVNRGSAADVMIRMAGGVNAIDSVGGMTRLTPELIAKAAPDVIVATDVGFDRFGSAEKFGTLPGVALTPAGRARRIYRVDETEVMYFGPRTPAALRKLAGWFHP
jgi:iron complex transport system substrate-binding protein